MTSEKKTSYDPHSHTLRSPEFVHSSASEYQKDTNIQKKIEYQTDKKQTITPTN